MERIFRILKRDAVICPLIIGAAALLLILSARSAEPTEKRISFHANPDCSETLRIAVSADERPYSYVLEDGELRGFHPELANYIADRLQMRPEFTVSSAKGALETVRSGKADIAIGCELLSDDNTDHGLILSAPVAEDMYSVFGTEPIDSPIDLDGKRIAAVSGSCPTVAFRDFGLSEISYFDTLREAMESVRRGENDYAVGRSVAGTVLCQMQNEVPLYEFFSFGGSRMCVGISADNRELASRVGDAVNGLIREKVPNELAKKWLTASKAGHGIALVLRENRWMIYVFAATFIVMIAALILSRIANLRSERIELEATRTAVINTLTNEYDAIQYVNLVTGESVPFRTMGIASIGAGIPTKNREEYDIQLKAFAQNYIVPSDRKQFLKNAALDVILQNVRDGMPYYVNYRMIADPEPLFYQTKFAGVDRSSYEVVAGIHSVDDEVKKGMLKQEELEQMVAARTAELQNKTRAMTRLNEEIVEMLCDIVEGRDKSSGDHVRRVKELTRILGKQVMKEMPKYHLTERDVSMISSASALHDIGKIVIPDAILKKPGRLTEDEFAVMKTHTTEGVDILATAPSDWGREYIATSMDICGGHHEKWDGRGYPKGLKGDEIPISAQIVSIADVYDALTNERVYKKAFDPDVAFQMILNGECGAYSPGMLKCLENCRTEFERLATEGIRDSRSTEMTNLFSDSLSGIRVLLVDDNDLSGELNMEILEAEGCVVTLEKNGRKGFEEFRDRGIGAYDVVLMDLIMPEMDGMEAISQIRSIGTSYAVNIPIIALTGECTEEQMDLSVMSGADACMTKPLVISDFTKKLFACMRKRSEVMEKKITDTMELAYTDSLTGVRNITAYTEAVAELTRQMDENVMLEFAIVMCDVNSLKEVNDRYGHSAGDQYIKNACNLLLDTFHNSAVYRIGGDEFVVILTEMDYLLREKLVVELRKKVQEAEKISDIVLGRASFMAGIAEYDPEIDKTVSDVVKRADALMYERKQLRRSNRTEAVLVTEETEKYGRKA